MPMTYHMSPPTSTPTMDPYVWKPILGPEFSAKMVGYYMRVAIMTANLSHAYRSKVGCIAVKDNPGRIISIGYNGMPPGQSNIAEVLIAPEGSNGDRLDLIPSRVEILKEYLDLGWKLVTKPQVIHAEANCIAKISSSSESSKDAVIFVTMQPCIECAKILSTAKVRAVVYYESYRDPAGIEFLKMAGVPCISYQEHFPPIKDVPIYVRPDSIDTGVSKSEQTPCSSSETST